MICVWHSTDRETIRCGVCGYERKPPKQWPLVRKCPGPLEPESEETTAAEPGDEQHGSRLEVCLSCADMDHDAPGCRLMPKCSRTVLWESALRVGRCPKRKWGERLRPVTTIEVPMPLPASPAKRRVVAIGTPGPCGGANTELWHTLRVWAHGGLEVHVIPTWNSSPEWQKKLRAAGINVILSSREDVTRVPELQGATVVSFCNKEFLALAPRLREMGCRLVWVNCMCWMFDAEIQFAQEHGPFDAYVCQSKYQAERLWGGGKKKGHGELGVKPDQVHLIRGAFWPEEFPHAPRHHRAGSEFWFGRLSRADKSKWSSNLWNIYRGVPYAKKKVRAMGWSDEIAKKLGKPPGFVEVLRPDTEDAYSFLSSLHALVQVNGGAEENWPRVGLEAMAAGVPLVVQAQWGWKEMIEHEASGLLCENDDDFRYWVARLARDEEFRQKIIAGGLQRVRSLCDVDTTVSAWKEVLQWQ